METMEMVKLGPTGLDVSRICLGCMSFGVPDRGGQTWSLDEETSLPFFRHAVELGINFFDTANIYSDGTSEEITGRALKEFARREEIVVATKVFNPMHQGPNAKGLSRKSIMREIDNSLRRLGMDYVDLYQIHRFDPFTPIEETMEALHDVVKAGKALHIGASSMYAWQFAKMQHAADLNGWTRFATMQNHYNLLYREEEREMIPLCYADDIGIIPWSPLARGRLTRDWSETTERSQKDEYGKKLYAGVGESDRQIVAAVKKLAEERGVPRAQIALAWMLDKPWVSAPIIGATKLSHIDDAVAALSIQLSEDEIALLEEPYVPHPILGHS